MLLTLLEKIYEKIYEKIRFIVEWDWVDRAREWNKNVIGLQLNFAYTMLKGLLQIPRLSHRFVFTNARHFTHNDIALCATTFAFARYTLFGPSFRLNSTPADDAVIHNAFTLRGIQCKIERKGHGRETARLCKPDSSSQLYLVALSHEKLDKYDDTRNRAVAPWSKISLKKINKLILRLNNLN